MNLALKQPLKPAREALVRKDTARVLREASESAPVQRIPARMLFVDMEQVKKGRQRDPTELKRLKELYKHFGENGELFDPVKLRVLVVSMRPDGRYAIVDGGGRHLATTEICDRPDWVFNCIVVTGLSLEEEGILFWELDRDKVDIAKGQVFWILANDPAHKHEFAIGEELRNTLEGFTTLPKKPGCVTENSAKFLYSLGGRTLLRQGLSWAEDIYNSPNGKTGKPVKRGSIEGTMLTALGAFIHLYGKECDIERAKGIFRKYKPKVMKQMAAKYIPVDIIQRHPRDYAKAIVEFAVEQYGLNLGRDQAALARKGKGKPGVRTTPRLSAKAIDKIEGMIPKGKPFRREAKDVWKFIAPDEN